MPRLFKPIHLGANRLKLEEYNAGERVSEINLTAAKIAREIVGQQAL